MSKQSAHRRRTIKAEVKREVEWNDYPELFEAVGVALEGNLDVGMKVVASEEQGGYHEDGYIDLLYNGQRFRLNLALIG